MALPFFAMMYNLLHERREVAVEENCRSGTDDVGSAPLVLVAAAAGAPDEDTLRLGLVATVGDSGSGSRDTVGCSDGS